MFNKGVLAIILSILVGISIVNYMDNQEIKSQLSNIGQFTTRSNKILEAFSQFTIELSKAVEQEQMRTQTLETLTCMTQNLYFEGGNQDYQSKLAIAQIVRERQEKPKYPNNICGVVKQKKWHKGRWVGQFSWFTDGKPDTKPTNKVELIAWNKSREVAQAMIIGDFNRDPDLIGATLYHAYYVKPDWDWSKTRYIKQVGDHLFYEEI
ncbi:MAG: cell wall hydrolase [Candidatus Izemoplasma sp.]